MLETRVLSLGVLTDDGKVDILVTGRVAGKRLADNERSVNVELLAHGDVPRVVRSSLDRSEENTLQTNLVALERLHGLLEQRLGTVGLAGNVELLPLDGHVHRLEDLLDRVSDLDTDTVTWDKGNSVYTSILGGALGDLGGAGSKRGGRSKQLGHVGEDKARLGGGSGLLEGRSSSPVELSKGVHDDDAARDEDGNSDVGGARWRMKV